MWTDFPYTKANSCCNASGACMCYKFTLSCTGEIGIYDVKACNGTLSLVPGAVTADNGLSCGSCGSDIVIPSCASYAVEQRSVPIEPSCQTICGASDDDTELDGCNSGYQSCCIWTSTNKQASTEAVCVGDTVNYRITFTNHSAVTLDMVFISDNVPAGVTVVPGSIFPEPKPGETLETGISMGGLAAGQSVVLRYSVTVDPGVPCKIVNCACARYCYTDCRGCLQSGTGSCKSCAITLKNSCFCQCVCRCFSLCGFSCFRDCYVYHRGVKNYETKYGRISIVGFGIAVKYIDLNGEKRSKFFEGSVIFHGLSDHFFSGRFQIHFTNPLCKIDGCGNMQVQFAAQLRSENAAEI